MLIDRRRLTVTALARESGVNRKHLHDILAGRTSPTLDTVARIAVALGVDPHEIIRPSR